MDADAQPSTDMLNTVSLISYCSIQTVPAMIVTLHAVYQSVLMDSSIVLFVVFFFKQKTAYEMVLAYLNKGQFFGEMGLFHEQPARSAWVRTRTASEMAEMTYSRFRQISSESPGLVFELATQLASRLDRTNRKLGDLAFVDVTGRVAHAIMDLCDEPDAMTHPDGMQIKVSRQELSRLVGCSREMAGRVLKVLEEQGLVSASGKTIVVYGARPNRNL